MKLTQSSYKGQNIWKHSHPGSQDLWTATHAHRYLPCSLQLLSEQSSLLCRLAGIKSLPLTATGPSIVTYKIYVWESHVPSLSPDFLICQMGESRYLP